MHLHPSNLPFNSTTSIRANCLDMHMYPFHLPFNSTASIRANCLNIGGLRSSIASILVQWFCVHPLSCGRQLESHAFSARDIDEEL